MLGPASPAPAYGADAERLAAVAAALADRLDAATLAAAQARGAAMSDEQVINLALDEIEHAPGGAAEHRVVIREDSSCRQGCWTALSSPRLKAAIEP